MGSLRKQDPAEEQEQQQEFFLLNENSRVWLWYVPAVIVFIIAICLGGLING